MEIYLELQSSDELPYNDENITGILSTIEISTEYPLYMLDKDTKITLNGNYVGNKVHVENPDQMEKILDSDIEQNQEILFVSTGSWQIIPFENLIAKYRKSGIKIIGQLENEGDIELFPKILEVGIDGFLMRTSDYEKFKEKLVPQEIAPILSLEELEVTHIEPTGVGDRVCVDTFSLLKEGEGLLVGSTSKVFAFIEAEVHESGFVRARPFRVNSGVVSLYLLNNEKTNYLSELSAGSAVTVVNREGKMRRELVARIKIEKRPMVLVKIKHNNRDYPVVIQNAETVRLMTTTDSIPVNELKVGDKILCHTASGARHFGHSVDEFVEER